MKLKENPMKAWKTPLTKKKFINVVFIFTIVMLFVQVMQVDQQKEEEERPHVSTIFFYNISNYPSLFAFPYALRIVLASFFSELYLDLVLVFVFGTAYKRTALVASWHGNGTACILSNGVPYRLPSPY